jgi:hypothetical protein|tara:strand:+ start:569 stop:742 length:174 start_codon:yes stop_codon:yes gene_type:complete
MPKFKSYKSIDDIIRAYICTVAGISRVEDISLTEINTFLSDLNQFIDETREEADDYH